MIGAVSRFERGGGSARCGETGWVAGVVMLEPPYPTGPLLDEPSGSVGLGCRGWRSSVMDSVAIGAGETIGLGPVPATGPRGAAGPGVATASWLSTGDGLLATGATRPSLTIAVIPMIAPPARTTKAATAALVPWVLVGSDATVVRRWLATLRRWGSAPIHAINALAGGPEPALRR